jgi:hypothetical protein
VVSPAHRPLPDNSEKYKRERERERDIHAQRDSNLQSQQLSGGIDSAATEIWTSDNKSIKCFTPE